MYEFIFQKEIKNQDAVYWILLFNTDLFLSVQTVLLPDLVSCYKIIQYLNLKCTHINNKTAISGMDYDTLIFRCSWTLFDLLTEKSAIHKFSRNLGVAFKYSISQTK